MTSRDDEFKTAVPIGRHRLAEECEATQPTPTPLSLKQFRNRTMKSFRRRAGAVKRRFRMARVIA
jgi:hypothetical protein